MSLIKLPIYKGLETQYEDIVYQYFRQVLKFRGYSLKVKKADFTEIDGVIASYASGTIGRGMCDAYVFSGEGYEQLFGLIELESEGKLEVGISQVTTYAKSIRKAVQSGELVLKNDKLLNIIFDGQLLFVAEYDLINDVEPIVIINKENVGSNHETITETLINQFPDRNTIIDFTNEEVKLVKRTKKIIRNKEKIQKNKAALLTVLAAIYGELKERDFSRAINRLSRGRTPKLRQINSNWELMKNEIDYASYENDVKTLYENVACDMYELSQNKGMDLYGYIYEELATKDSKKESGEYYTPRHHIEPIIKVILNRYLTNWTKENINNKKIADIFCGSGGFLYEFLKLVSKRYVLTKEEIDQLSSSSIYGMDANAGGILASYLNLYLIGDGSANLTEVETSLNWRNAWLYKQEKRGDVINKVKVNTENELKANLERHYEAISSFLKLYIQEESLHTLINNGSEYLYNDMVSTLTEDLEDEFSMENPLLHFDEPLMKYLYKKLPSGHSYIDYNDFINGSGNVDLLMTNVPYGTITDLTHQVSYFDESDGRTKSYGLSLEATSLRECIDLLRPKKLSPNGGEIEQGGIGVIIVPDGILENEDNQKIRDYLFSKCDIKAVISLPPFTFSPYTMEKTYVLVIQKRAVAEFGINHLDKERVFMYISDGDGKANSAKRYETKHIERAEVKQAGGRVLTVSEYLHDDFATSLETYTPNVSSINYMSKLERAWQWETWINDPEWNQVRYIDKWNGMEWEKLPGKTWGFYDLITKSSIRINERSNKQLSNKILRFFEEKEKAIDEFNIEDFIFNNDPRNVIEEIIDWGAIYAPTSRTNLTENQISMIESCKNITCVKNNDEVSFIFNDGVRGRTNKALTKKIKENYFDGATFNDGEEIDVDSLVEWGKDFILSNTPNLTDTHLEYLRGVDKLKYNETEEGDVFFTFITEEVINSICLLPEDQVYLGQEYEEMSEEDLLQELERLVRMQGEGR